MAEQLHWLEDTLLGAGLKVATSPGWRERGRGPMGEVLGVMCHHTAGPAQGNMPSLSVITSGRPGLSGPLAHLGLGRDGTWYVVAAGRCNHAGAGEWRGITGGNTHFIGIEAENTGTSVDPWPLVQVESYAQGVAALLRHAGRGYEYCVGHKEFARPVGRKIDPSFDMDAFRQRVRGLLDGTASPRPLIPAIEHATAVGGAAPRPTLRRGASGPRVGDVQRILGVAPADGQFGPRTEAAVRQFQRSRALVPDGIIGPATWAALDRDGGSPPG